MTATYYRAGKFNGRGPELYIVRFLRTDGTFSSCQCVEEGELARELTSLRALGWKVTRE